MVDKERILHAKAQLADELAAYVNIAEKAICGEWCTGQWPDCDYQLHDEAKVLLARYRKITEAGTTKEPTPPKCICPRFSDTGGYRIADLCCPIHGVDGTDPGDGPWEEADNG